MSVVESLMLPAACALAVVLVAIGWISRGRQPVGEQLGNLSYRLRRLVSFGVSILFALLAFATLVFADVGAGSRRVDPMLAIPLLLMSALMFLIWWFQPPTR